MFLQNLWFIYKKFDSLIVKGLFYRVNTWNFEYEKISFELKVCCLKSATENVSLKLPEVTLNEIREHRFKETFSF